jgi:hypothetical protein
MKSATHCLLSLAALISISATALFGCSGTAGQSLFNSSGPSPKMTEPPPPNYAFGNPDAGAPAVSDAPTTCAPANVGAMQATWTPPEPFGQNVCTGTQIAGFYTACLTSPLDPAVCNQFEQANVDCSQCLDTQDGDSALGPVVWHLNHTYYTVNLAGCIARERGDVSASGCGATYGETVECQEQACNACFATAAPTFTMFTTCEGQAEDSVCNSLHESIAPACGDLDSGPAAACFPPSGATAQDAYMLVAPKFCGPG